MSSGRSILITGINGFVGSYLSRKLLNQGHKVSGIVRNRADGLKPRLLSQMGILNQIRLTYGDVQDITSLVSAIQESEPDWIFHLASQSYVPRSFKDPIGTFRTNCLGTQNLLDAVRLESPNSKVIYAGSSEEYGLQFLDENHYNCMIQKYGPNAIEPIPVIFPELPVNEESAMRPMSPYATSKLYGDYAARNYHITFGLNTVVSRAFNHEGAARGHNFVTSSIVRQLVSVQLGEKDILKIGDIGIFRDWSHIEDIIDGYILLAEEANPGSTYVQGSMRTHSVLSYILYTIEKLGHEIQEIHSITNEKRVTHPLAEQEVTLGNVKFRSNYIDSLLLNGGLQYGLKDKGLIVETDKRTFKIQFDPERLRSSDVPLLLSNIKRIQSKLNFTVKRQISDIIEDQINYYLDRDNRNAVLQ